MRAFLILGCNGHSERYSGEYGFTYCQSVKNPILDLTRIPIENKKKVIEFLDTSCGLFDFIQHDRNKVSNIISLLYRRFDAFDEDCLHRIQAFIHMHKRCGVYLMLITKEDYECLI